MSIMMGVEAAVRSLRTHSMAIDTTTHNLANMNNAWYSRQLANITSTAALTMIGSAGQIGTGSKIGAIERIRDIFLDKQIWLEQQNVGKWDMINRTYKSLAALFPEVDGVTGGLQAQLDAFWESWQQLSTAAAAGDTSAMDAAKREIYQSAQGLAETMNNKSSALTDLQINLNSDMRNTVNTINQYITQIYELNKSIVRAQNMGQRPNDLFDRRNEAITKLNNLVNVNVGDRSDGSVVVHIHGHVLVNGADAFNFMTTLGGKKDSKLEEVGLFEYKGASPVNIQDYIENGQLAGIINSRDDVVHWYKMQLDSLANSMITVVNRIYRTAYANGAASPQTNINFFLGNKSSSIAVNPALNSGTSIAYAKYTSNDIADILGNLDNKLMNNWVEGDAGNFYGSATSLGIDGKITINGTDVFYTPTDTIATLVQKINSNVADFAMTFDEDTHSFFMVANQLITIQETPSTVAAKNDPTQWLLFRLKWGETLASTAPINYSDATSVNTVNPTASWSSQSDVLDLETSPQGTMIVNFLGKQYKVYWKEGGAGGDTPFATIKKLSLFNDPTPFDLNKALPKFDFYYFDTASMPQKFALKTGIDYNNNGVPPTDRSLPLIAPATINDEQGNMTQVMKFMQNMRFGDLYSMITGQLNGQLDTGENISGEYHAALEQFQGMQDAITRVNENQEILQAKMYQRAYDASVRLMSVIDEMLNMLINRTATPSSSWD